MSTFRSDAKQDGLSKVLSRMKTVLRRDPSTKATSAVARETPAPGQPESSKAPSQPKCNHEPTESVPEPIILTNWGAIQEEKARALFAKYGLTLEPGEWKATRDVPVQRVVKPIRMRVRRTCHRCQTTYGPDRVCVNCQHVRCKKCPQYPAPRPKDEQERTETALQTILAQKAQPVQPKPRKHQLTMPSRTGGQDLIRKPVRQRVRRTCHRCNTLFGPHATECASCRHLRCKLCPRDPYVSTLPTYYWKIFDNRRAKHDKYPDGYPGDAEPPFEPPARTWKKPRQRVRYTCHECSTLYRSGQNHCANCGQERCAETIRDPPKRHKPEPDPEIVQRVEERLASIKFTGAD
ncbi:hypothetical protein BDW74DRAFT_153883 [Aspergillus multicolor]|uniref:uncharacterized protein n=1 Tax=Aspergillus multicolor TaxID=41759 RepID=UPI003CCDFC4D